MPLRGLDAVGTGERIVVVPVLDVGLGEDAHAAELAGLSGTVSGGQQDLGSDEGAGAAERGLAGDIHHEQDDGGMGVPVELAVGDEGGASQARRIRGYSVAAEQDDASDSKDRDDATCPHGSSLQAFSVHDVTTAGTSTPRCPPRPPSG